MSVIKCDFKNKSWTKEIDLTPADRAILQKWSTTTDNPLSDLKEKLEARYGANQPSHGVLYYTPITRLKGQFYFDTYGNGCAHASNHDKYFVNRDLATYNRPQPFPTSPTMIDDLINNEDETVINLGLKSDAFMWMDLKYGVTKYLLKNLNKDIKLIIHTRSDLVAHDDYLELLRNFKTVEVRMYIPKHDNEHRARIEEPGCPSIKRRCMAMDTLRAAGIAVSLVETVVVRKARTKRNTDKETA